MNPLTEYETRQLITDRLRAAGALQRGSRVPAPRRREAVTRRLRAAADRHDN